MSGAPEKAMLLRSEDVAPRHLDALAATIREQHGMVLESLRRTLEHIIQCGEALLEARSLIPSGAWSAWLSENVGVHRTTAQWYMRVARFRNELRLVGVTNLSEAQSYLRANGLVLELARRPASDDVVVEIHALAGNGLTHREIAERTGVGKTTVSRKLRQRTPKRPAVEPAVEPQDQTQIEITDDMIEGMARWLAARGQPLTDRTRMLATEALRVSLNYRGERVAT